jgi:N-acetylglucosamine-6-sulfatase
VEAWPPPLSGTARPHIPPHSIRTPRYDLQDDQDLVLGSLDVMPTVRSRVFEAGMTFENAFVATPLCCPSRTATLTGRFPHNLNDEGLGWCGNYLTTYMNNTFVDDLHNAGYHTILSGKLINDMGSMCSSRVGSPVVVPTGFDQFQGMCNEVTYYNNFINLDGVMMETGAPGTPNSYLTSVLGNQSVAWLHSALAGEKPVFAYIAPHAPHLPATPAPWYEDVPMPSQAPRTPSWNVASPDKHWLLAGQPPMSEVLINASDTTYANRLRSLLSVDDMVAAVLDELDASGEPYYFFYVSDHGYHLGQFRLFVEKREPYDTDIRVPLAVRGPGITANSTSAAIVANVDLGATILELAGVAPRVTDGRSFASQLGPSPPTWPRDRALIEMWAGMDLPATYQFIGPCSPMPPCSNGSGYPTLASLIDAPGNTYSGLRIINDTHNFAYVEFRPRNSSMVPASSNWTEVYDLAADPWSLTNLAGSLPKATLEAFSAELWALATCTLGNCP